MRTETPARLGLGALLAALAGIYVTQTLVTTIAMQSLPVLLRQAGASLQLVGLSALFMLPWALRFLWAPTVERWRLPVDTVRRRSRTLILRGQWLLAAGMLAVASAGVPGWLSLQAHGAWLLGSFFLAAVLAATVDIACGGFAVDQLTQERRGWGNTAKVGGSYFGMLLGGSAFLLLAQRHGWPLALGAGGAATVLLTLPLAGVTVLVGLLFGAMACGFVAIYSALMGLASPSQPGVDFALFQCADALIAMAGGVAGGWLAQRFGYDACFALAAGMAAGAAAFAARRHG